MTAVSIARTELDAVRDKIGDAAFQAISAGLDMAEDLRSTPAREASAAVRARVGAEFRRQPHLALVPDETAPGQPSARTSAAPATSDSSLP
ncbi:MAG TPA: hypothetical protein VGI72_08590 [Gaiellales bacterium]|jgi:hypothetical protein